MKLYSFNAVYSFYISSFKYFSKKSFNFRIIIIEFEKPAGIDGNNEELYVIIKKDGGETTVLNTAEVVTESEAKSITQADKKPERILEARLGIENEEPVWEVTYKNANDTIGYYLISAISGKWLKDIENI